MRNFVVLGAADAVPDTDCAVIERWVDCYFVNGYRKSQDGTLAAVFNPEPFRSEQKAIDAARKWARAQGVRTLLLRRTDSCVSVNLVALVVDTSAERRRKLSEQFRAHNFIAIEASDVDAAEDKVSTHAPSIVITNSSLIEDDDGTLFAEWLVDNRAAAHVVLCAEGPVTVRPEITSLPAPLSESDIDALVRTVKASEARRVAVDRRVLPHPLRRPATAFGKVIQRVLHLGFWRY